ncbi:MAG: helix-turn-helix domain-containing protein [Actinomycetota bacterium]
MALVHDNDQDDSYMKTSEVARLLRVSPKTVSRWAKEGKLPHLVTLGGHRRFPARAIRALADQLQRN